VIALSSQVTTEICDDLKCSIVLVVINTHSQYFFLPATRINPY